MFGLQRLLAQPQLDGAVWCNGVSDARDAINSSVQPQANDEIVEFRAAGLCPACGPASASNVGLEACGPPSAAEVVRRHIEVSTNDEREFGTGQCLTQSGEPLEIALAAGALTTFEIARAEQERGAPRQFNEPKYDSGRHYFAR